MEGTERLALESRPADSFKPLGRDYAETTYVASRTNRSVRPITDGHIVTDTTINLVAMLVSGADRADAGLRM
ncbi:MAG TPA: hypothetical protein VHI11_08605, partial [Jiangellaceae bacterium]|nr:hypothetical protein [Jiangellaceae bacterium]